MYEPSNTVPITPARPRRSGRAPAKAPPKAPSTVVAPASVGKSSSSPQTLTKRKARNSEKSPAEKLEQLLTSSKSKLTKVDISDVINYNNFLELSEEAQTRLCALLPPVAFSTYVPSVSPSHPDFRQEESTTSTTGNDDDSDGMNVPGPSVSDARNESQTHATLDPMFFTSAFFLSAARTFQDHLFSSWLGRKAGDELEKFMQGARDGTLHAEWKDEVWERDHHCTTSSKRKQSPTVDLTLLAKRDLLRVGDELVYRRAFPALDVTVEKDLLVDTVDPNSHAITFLLSPGTRTSLHPSLLSVSGTREYDGKVLSMEDISDPVALERGVLDVDGRVGYSDKYEHDIDAASYPRVGRAAPSTQTQIPSGLGTPPAEQLQNMISVRAWKAFTLWRWGGEMRERVNLETQLMQDSDRGGREKIASLFYLRGCCVSG